MDNRLLVHGKSSFGRKICWWRLTCHRFLGRYPWNDHHISSELCSWCSDREGILAAEHTALKSGQILWKSGKNMISVMSHDNQTSEENDDYWPDGLVCVVHSHGNTSTFELIYSDRDRLASTGRGECHSESACSRYKEIGCLVLVRKWRENKISVQQGGSRRIISIMH